MRSQAKQHKTKDRKSLWVRASIVFLGMAMMSGASAFVLFDEVRSAVASTTTPYWQRTDATATGKLFYNDGNVGIGTNAAVSKLDVRGLSQ